ncbi:unnamed protein product [Cuscuta campestris]|uniref:BTB domain-containing protein n=1 Tax=Cuscuta campestris TaxID=132261 RepID=A0A484KZB6_9ASTE|nr:unnamed protein product [Cuscuta campestris]
MRSSSSKQGADNKHGISGHVRTLHQRLHHALGLGLHDDKGRNWNFTDFNKQRLVIHSIDAFLDNLSLEALKHPLVKDSVPNMVGALGSILESESEVILISATKVAIKIASSLPCSVLRSHSSSLVIPLSSLLSSHQSQVSVSSATALKSILSNLSTKRENEVWEILKQKNVVAEILQNLNEFSSGNKSNEFFQEMASLLSKILQMWPPSRLCVYTDTKLLNYLDTLTLSPMFSIQSSLLHIYSAIALCRNGAKTILDNGDNLLKMMVDSMDISKPYSVQMGALNLAQCLMMCEEECSTIIKICGESIVKAIMTGMGYLSRGKNFYTEHMPRLVESCSLALITRWAGEHHHYFCKAGIGGVLLNLFMGNFPEDNNCLHSLPLQEKIVIIQSHEGLQTNFCLPLRPYIWDILGHLATHSTNDCNPMMHGHEACLNTLVVCACLGFVDSMSVTHQTGEDNNAHESVSRAVLKMIYSPWKHLAFQTRHILSEVLKSNGKNYVRRLLSTLRITSSGTKIGMPSNLQILISLMGLTCYSALPNYKNNVIDNQGVTDLLAFIRWWLVNPLPVKRMHLAPHTQNIFCVRACCWGHLAEWEGEDMLLLLGLWCLAELVVHSGSHDDDHAVMSKHLEGGNDALFIEELQQICYQNLYPGPRWYASYILWHLGLYGFANRFGQRICKALNEDIMPDLELIHGNQGSFFVHSVILSVRCPSLLPSKEALKEKPQFGSLSKCDVETHKRSMSKVQLSPHADHQILAKLLEYVYSGYFQAGEDLIKKLRVYAKRCNLHSLLHMLYRRRPKWGEPFPTFDLTCALGSTGYHFSDIILEAKAANFAGWRCSFCCSLVPHYHLHKVILCSSSDYLQALFSSGMQESHLQTLKVPVNWECLVKLVNWFYSGELPGPMSGCLWDSLDTDAKLEEVRPYVELCWLTEFWLISNGLHEDCFGAVLSCLDSCQDLSIKIMQIAAEHSQWKLVGVATEYAAPLYHLKRSSGELDALEENLVEMIRAASVQLSQEKL